MKLYLFAVWLSEWDVWKFTKWLSDQGISDLFAAVGTVAATTLAVWQAGALLRERSATAKASAQVAIWAIESALSALSKPESGPAYVGAQCEGVSSTLREISVTQLTSSEAVRALMNARAALHVIAERSSYVRAARDARRPVPPFITYGDQATILRSAANELRRSLGQAQIADPPKVARKKVVQVDKDPDTATPSDGAVS